MDSDDGSERAAPASPRPTSSRHGSSKHVHGSGHVHTSGSAHKHSKPWTARLYRKHDAKHHRGEPEAGPLLTEAEPEETEDEDQIRNHQHRRGCCGHVHHDFHGSADGISGALHWLGAKTCDAIECVGDTAASGGRALANGGKAVARGTKRTGQALRNNPKKVMAAALAIFATTTAGLGGKMAYDHFKKQPGCQAQELCTTSECIEASQWMLQNLHPSVAQKGRLYPTGDVTTGIDPCTHFDQFVCGGFEERFDLKEDQGGISTDTLVAEQNENLFKRILEQPTPAIPAKDKVLTKMLQKAYGACMEPLQTGLKPLKDVVDNIKKMIPTSNSSRGGPRRLHQGVLGGTNVIDGLDDALTDLLEIGIDTLLHLDVVPSLTDPDKYITEISPILVIGLPAPDFYRDAALVTEYRGVTAKMLEIFYDTHLNSTSILGRHRNIRASILDLAQGTVDMEVKVALSLPLPGDLIGAPKKSNEMSIKDANKRIAQLDLEKIISKIAPKSYRPDTVLVPSPEYLERLSFVLQATPVEVIQAYMVWKSIQHLAGQVQDPKLEPLQKFQAKLAGASRAHSNQPWCHCVREVNGMLGWAMSRLFLKNAWDDGKHTASQTAFVDVKGALAGLMNNTEWLADDDKETAAKKISSMKAEIGSPKNMNLIKSLGALEDYYKTLKLGKSHFDNKLETSRFQTSKFWSRLTEPKSPRWREFADEVYYDYDYPLNTAIFSAGLLQAPFFFGASVPEYFTYGAFGMTAGREQALAVSSIGSHYAPNGTLNKGWSNETREAFQGKAECFAKQYDQFTVEGPDKVHMVDGKTTLINNMADIAGLQAAFNAWKDAGKPGKTLPGLEKYSKEQLFFMSFGNRFCSKTTPAKAVERLLTDNYAPNPARILGTVANSKDFREAFKCSAKKPTCELL